MNEFHWIAVAVVTVLSASRFTRLLIFDDFPLTKIPRNWVAEHTEPGTRFGSLHPLTYCPFCVAPWVTIAVVLTGYYTGFPAAWWLVNGISAASYLAATYMVHDGEEAK